MLKASGPTAVDPSTLALGAAIEVVGSFLAAAGYEHFDGVLDEADTKRNRHLKLAVVSALRPALADAKRVETHRRLFGAWDTMLERATKELAWLDQLLPGDALEASLQHANEYGRADEAEPALRDLLRGWLDPPTPLLPEDRALYNGLVFHWDAEAEKISAEVLPSFQQNFTTLVSGDAKGQLHRAFETKTLLRIDQRVGEMLERQVGRDEMFAIFREAVQSAPLLTGDSPRPAGELPTTLVEWAKRRGLTPDAVRQEIDAWEYDLEQAAKRGEPRAAGEQALDAFARRELDRAADLAASETAAAEGELAEVEEQLAELTEKQRVSRRQAWENRMLQARALFDKWRFSEAVAAYRSALEVYTQQELPQSWATTQNNLGNTLKEHGIRTSGEAGAALLAEAVAAYRSALEVRTQQELPQGWAMTQNNLGSTLKEQGIRTGGEAGAALLAEAVAAYRSALEVFTEEVASHYSSLVQRNLARALKLLAEHSGP